MEAGLVVILLNALIARHPHAQSTRLINAHREHIERVAVDASNTHHIPLGLLLAVGYVETWCGTYPGEGGGWGAPIDAQHRHTAGTADTAARILETSYRLCGSWERAVNRFRSGLCDAPRSMQGYTRTVLSIVRRIYTEAGVPVPELVRRNAVQ